MQVEEPVYFVDFLREPEVDEETGEVVDAHPSFYEGVTKGLPEVKTRVEALQVCLMLQQTKVADFSSLQQRCSLDCICVTHSWSR